MASNTVISLDAKVTALNDFMNTTGGRIAARKGVSVSDLNVQETDLVLGAAFDVKRNKYDFYIFGDKKFPFEQKLSDKDVFLAHEIESHILKADVTAGDFAKIFFPYIDKTEFNGAKNGNTEAAALEAWFHGTLKISRGGIPVIENFRMRNLMRVPDRQLKDDVYPTMNADAFKLTRKPVFGGKDKIEISVELGELSTESRALITGKIDDKGDVVDDMQNFAIIVLRGFVIAEAAEAYYTLK